MFLKLLEYCFYDYDVNKIRCTVQCRADQNTKELEKYWHTVTHVPKRHFYKTRVDKRTFGKKTLNKNYKGVLRIVYLSSNTQLDLEALSGLIYEKISGPVV